MSVTDAPAPDSGADLFGATPVVQGVAPLLTPTGFRGRRQGALLRLRADIPASLAIGLAALGLAALFGGWLLLSSMMDPLTVPSPAATWDAGVELWRSGRLWADFTASAERLGIGYAISLAIGVVIGVSIASFRSAEAFFEAQIGFLRYIPANALLPLFLIWFGIGESPKIWLVVIGTVFFNILMIADVARAVPQELVDASYTLGAGRLTVLRRVILPHSYPGIIDVARVNLAAGWLMLVVAELLAADDGLAVRIARSQRSRATDTMFAVLIVFGVIGLVSDLALRALRRRTAPWSEGSR